MLTGLGAQTGRGQTSDREDADLDQECSPCPPKLGQRTGKSSLLWQTAEKKKQTLTACAQSWNQFFLVAFCFMHRCLITYHLLGTCCVLYNFESTCTMKSSNRYLLHVLIRVNFVFIFANIILKMYVFIYSRGLMMMPVFMIKSSGIYQIKLLLILFLFANAWKMLYVHAIFMTQEGNWREKKSSQAMIWSKFHDRIQKLFVSLLGSVCQRKFTFLNVSFFVKWNSVLVHVCLHAHFPISRAIHCSGLEDLLLYIASSEDERNFSMHVLEIVSLMFREQVHVTLVSLLHTQWKAIRTIVIKNLDSTHHALQSEPRAL